jgi:membrane protein DedA with SNARE-associated domain
VAVAANVLGSWIAYGVGRFGRIELIERHGKWLHIKPSHIEWADRWFQKYGDAAVFFSRMLPIIRTFISLPAGVARMPFWRFTLFTVLGCIPWMVGLTFAGKQASSNWEDIQSYLHYFDYLVAALIIAGAVYLVVRWRRGRGDAADAPAT